MLLFQQQTDASRTLQLVGRHAEQIDRQLIPTDPAMGQKLCGIGVKQDSAVAAGKCGPRRLLL